MALIKHLMANQLGRSGSGTSWEGEGNVGKKENSVMSLGDMEETGLVTGLECMAIHEGGYG